jgi:hypothetical protein
VIRFPRVEIAETIRARAVGPLSLVSGAGAIPSKRRTKNNFLFSFPLTLPSPARGEGEKAKLFFVRP